MLCVVTKNISLQVSTQPSDERHKNTPTSSLCFLFYEGGHRNKTIYSLQMKVADSCSRYQKSLDMETNGFNQCRFVKEKQTFPFSLKKSSYIWNGNFFPLLPENQFQIISNNVSHFLFLWTRIFLVPV